jgi:hypothetical protein
MLNKEQKPLKIYIAGPYTASTKHDVERNVTKAIDVSLALFKKGHFPFIPHLTHYVEIRGKERNNAPSWIEYMMCDLAWLGVSDALYFIGSSRGADIELEAAHEDGLDIYYTLSEVPDVSVKGEVSK